MAISCVEYAALVRSRVRGGGRASAPEGAGASGALPRDQ